MDIAIEYIGNTSSSAHSDPTAEVKVSVDRYLPTKAATAEFEFLESRSRSPSPIEHRVQLRPRSKGK